MGWHPERLWPGKGSRSLRLITGTQRGLAPLTFSVVTIAAGAMTGLGAWVFRALIAVVHNLSFLGRLSIHYDTNLHTEASPWGWFVALVPAGGALVVVFLVRTFAPEAKGHGVPEVMDAIYYGKSMIRPVVAVIKSLASALSIGTGGSVGREGPIIQIGAALGSSLGGITRVSRWQRATLVAAGGGAGIAATFNTPLGGVLFAVEVLMHEVSVRTLAPVALATATATYVARFVFGNQPAFPVPSLAVAESVEVMPAFLILGVVTALASVVFIRAVYATEDAFEAVFGRHVYVAHVVGMLSIGLTFTTLEHLRGHYYVEGVGYATVIDVLTGTLANGWFLLLLFGLKLLATSVTLGSGASGGIFSPSLFLGATLGSAVGLAVRAALPDFPVSPALFAVTGMAGMVAGATGAVLTSIVMLFEMTLDYAVVLPMALTASVSYGLRQLLLPESIYTMKLARRGHAMPGALQANAHLVHHVSDVAMSNAQIVAARTPPSDIELDERTEGPAHLVLVDGQKIVGVLSRQWALAHRRRLHEARSLGEVAAHDFIVLRSDATLFELLAAMQRQHASVAVVLASPAPEGQGAAVGVAGILTLTEVAEAIAEGMELFED